MYPVRRKEGCALTAPYRTVARASPIDLGVTIDKTLNFSSHIRSMVKKATQTSWITLKCFTSGNRENLIRAYTTYVRPKLEYCTQLWSPQSRADSDLIERAQKHFTRMIYFRCGYRKEPYQARLRKLELDSLEIRRTKLDMCFAHKIYHEYLHCPNVLQKKMIHRPLVHNLRLQKEVHVPKFHSLFFANRIVTLWNKFTDEQLLNANKFHELIFPNIGRYFTASSPFRDQSLPPFPVSPGHYSRN